MPDSVFLRNELSIRFIQALKLLSLPTMPSHMDTAMAPIIDKYLQHLYLLSSTPQLSTNENIQSFIDVINEIQQSHLDTLCLFASTVNTHSSLLDNKPTLNPSFYEKFYLLNMSSALLMNEFISLSKSRTNLVKSIDLLDTTSMIAQESIHAFKSKGLKCPDINVLDLNESVKTNALYYEPHLKSILYELFDNSIKATIKTHSSMNHLPPIQVKIAAGNEDVSIQISDQAGGIPLSKVSTLWSRNLVFHKLTKSKPFGTNLASCNLMAKYFGGDLSLVSMEGLGTDTTLHLHQLGDHAVENLSDIHGVEVEDSSTWLLNLLSKQ
ncbi:histidine kinase-like ATPase [Globomyces pollinis-pini]|nr:histidine kinase-like ATPase [Globomyces pollinis-pini]KAJ2990788.1 [Pyruvate dehydrogenase (acetyl-transferring)] kinase isozyme 2 [Globomyces sp. JEL0801]